MTDGDGVVVWSADYLPFGQATVDPVSTVESNWRFPGQFWDGESGLHYNLMRSYAPRLGRYTRPDPVMVGPTHQAHRVADATRDSEAIPPSFDTQLPWHLDLYSYAGKNPLLNVDPEAEFIKEIGGILVKLFSCMKMFVYSSRLARARDKCDLELKCIGDLEFMEKYRAGYPSDAKLNCIMEGDPGTYIKWYESSVKCGFRFMF